MTNEQVVQDIRNMIKKFGMTYIPSRQDIANVLGLPHRYKVDRLGVDYFSEKIGLPKKLEVPKWEWIKIPDKPKTEEEKMEDMEKVRAEMQELGVEYFPKLVQIKNTVLRKKFQDSAEYTNEIAAKMGLLRYREYVKTYGKPKKEESNVDVMALFDLAEYRFKQEAEEKYTKQCKAGEVKTITGAEAQKYIERYQNVKEEKIPSDLNIVATSQKEVVNIAIAKQIIEKLEQGKSIDQIAKRYRLSKKKLNQFLTRSRSYKGLKTSKAI